MPHSNQADAASCQVLIVGAGPVGLTLALDLARRGIRCTIIEQNDAPAFQPKMERCNARTMEIFRRLGVVDQVRAAGLPPDCPMDVYVVTSLVDPPLVHHKYPSVQDARSAYRQNNDGSSPAEPYQLISQYTLEPLLKSILEKFSIANVRYGTRYITHRQNGYRVSTTVETKTGTDTIQSNYMVGCDGGASAVRKRLGIVLEGDGNLLRLFQSLFYSPDLFGRLPVGSGPGKGRHYHVADGASTMLIMQDSTKHWTLHSAANSPEELEPLFDSVVGVNITRQMIFNNAWRQNLLLAERYSSGRVFLAGDAVHLVVPFGGLGMNTGIGDAIDLSWKLAGVLQGWGGPRLLESYEIERRQVGERNVGAARSALMGRRKWRSFYRSNIREPSAEGTRARQALAEVAEVEQRKSNDMVGAELGYRYVDSPIICNIPGGPEHQARNYKPTNWPGARLPHIWLNSGASLHDCLPDGFSILNFGKRQIAFALHAAVSNRGALAHVVQIEDECAREVLGFDTFLIRPDMHIVWRGNALTKEPTEIASIALGYKRQEEQLKFA